MKGEDQANWHRFGYSDDCISTHCSRVIRFLARNCQHFSPSVLCMWSSISSTTLDALNLHPKTWLAAGPQDISHFHEVSGTCDASLLPDCGRWFAQWVTKSYGAMLPRVCSLLSQLLAIVHDRSDSLSLPRSFFNWAHSFSCSALGLLECLC